MNKNNKNYNNTIFLIDGNAYIHRAYHALPKLNTSWGLPINAVYGFIRMIFKILKNFKPKYLCICFDPTTPTFRNEIFKEYKANRKELEEDLKIQYPIIQEFISKSGIPNLTVENYEADDLICYLARKFEKDHKIIIISGDKDILQLVNKNIIVYNEHKDIWYNENKIKEKYLIEPNLLIDYFVLIGDKSDNISGIKGIGPKTAIEIIKKFGSIEEIIENIEKLEVKYREKILSNKEQLIKNKQLIKLIDNIEKIKEFSLEQLEIKKLNYKEIKEFIIKYNLKSILKELDKISNLFDIIKPNMQKIQEQNFLFNINNNEENINFIQNQNFIYINSEEKIKNLGNKIEIATTAIFLILAQKIDKTSSKKHKIIGLIGILKFSDNKDLKFYFPLQQHINLKNEILDPLSDKYYFLNFIFNFLKTQNLKITYDLKSQLEFLYFNYHNETKDFKIKNTFDIKILFHLLNPNKKISNLQELTDLYFGNKIVLDFILPYEIDFKNFQIERVIKKTFDTLNTILDIFNNLNEDFKKFNLLKLYEDIELPLVDIIVRMQNNGILIDKNKLLLIKTQLENELIEIKKQIKKNSEIEINLNSPKQLRFLLYEKLKLPPIKKTKTGYSTAEEVLLKLKDLHPLIPLLIKYRELEKLKNTYLEPILFFLNSDSSRIHTNFNITGTSTGRLSSEEPNLQNIPTKTDFGKKIRSIFIAPKNYKLVSLDYSQIELRILAHFSSDLNLINAFNNNQDIHKLTAQELFGLKEEDINENLRSIAKTINFGIIYGMSAQRLSKELNLTIQSAEEYINKYFEKHIGVKKWIEETIQLARKKGYVSTLFGRIRQIPEINSSNKQLRSFGERLAINTTIQGTAADIIKLAMIKIDNYIKNKNLDIKILLQIHDELLFEIKNEILEEINNIKNIMENIVNLKVKLVVNTTISDFWQ